MQKIGLILLSSLVLTSCASYYSSNGEKQYLRSKNGSNIVVPPPLTEGNLSHFYTLPPQNQDAQVSIEAPSLQDKEQS